MSHAHLPSAVQRTAAYVATARRLGHASPRRRVPIARPPTLVESDYAARLVAIVGDWRTAVADPLQRIAAAPHAVRADAVDERMDVGVLQQSRMLLDRTRDRVGAVTARVEHDARRAADQTQRHQRAELDRQTTAGLGVKLPVADRRLHDDVDHFVHENVGLIRSLGNRTFDDLEKTIARSFRGGERHEDLGDEIARRFEIAETHARLIARDQIAKLNAQVTRSRHRELGVERFQWITMRDGHVRPTHDAMARRNGGVWPYEGAGAPSFFPGEEVMCRCVEQPVFDDILSLVDDLLAA